MAKVVRFYTTNAGHANGRLKLRNTFLLQYKICKANTDSRLYKCRIYITNLENNNSIELDANICENLPALSKGKTRQQDSNSMSQLLNHALGRPIHVKNKKRSGNRDLLTLKSSLDLCSLVFCEGLPGVLESKGTKGKYRREQGNMNTCFREHGHKNSTQYKLEDQKGHRERHFRDFSYGHDGH